MATQPSTDSRIGNETEVEPLNEISAFQTDALAVIAQLGRPHGLAIKDEMEDRYDTVHHGRLYPNLDTLVECGLVEKGEIDNRTNSYTLTGKGARDLAAYRDWLSSCLGNDDD